MASIAPGDKNMAVGGAKEGTNQVSKTAVIKRAYVGAEKDHLFKADDGMSYYIISNGGRIDISSKRNGDIRLSKVNNKGFFKNRSGDRVEIFGVYDHVLTVTTPVTVKLEEAVSDDGTVTVDFICDQSSSETLEKLRSLLNNDFKSTDTSDFERYVKVTEEDLSKILGIFIGDCSLDTMWQFSTTFNLNNEIRSRFYDRIFRDSAFSNRGLIPGRSFLRFSESATEHIMKMKAEGKIALTEKEIKHEDKMLSIYFAKEEYDALKR